MTWEVPIEPCGKKLGIISSKDNISEHFSHPCRPDEPVFVIADVPHLVKNLRNHTVGDQPIILPDDVVAKFDLPGNTVCAKPLKQLVTYQENCELKPAPNLTSKHLQLPHFEKMKVSAALNVFSHSVSASIELLVDQGHLTKESLTTAWFLQTVIGGLHSCLLDFLQLL